MMNQRMKPEKPIRVQTINQDNTYSLIERNFYNQEIVIQGGYYET
jgi:hypothetical protein